MSSLTLQLPEPLSLHEGAEYDLHAVAEHGMLRAVTIVRTTPETKENQTRQEAGLAFLKQWGAAPSPAPSSPHATQEEDARLSYLNRKHVK